MHLPWSWLVHKKLATIATFAYSQVPLAQMRSAKFKGRWRFLDKFLHEIPQEEANKALMELAIYFRTLDDRESLSDYWKQTGVPSVGTLHLSDGSTMPLSPREMSNKVIHAKNVEWIFSGEDPEIICTAGLGEKWTRAEITVFGLISIGGQLGS